MKYFKGGIGEWIFEAVYMLFVLAMILILGWIIPKCVNDVCNAKWDMPVKITIERR